MVTYLLAFGKTHVILRQNDRPATYAGKFNWGRIIMDSVMVAIVCGLAAVAYGIFTSRQVLSASPGNARMQEIAKAIQIGAGAYLTKQYTAIAIVGVIVAGLVAGFLGVIPAIAFVLGAVLSGATGFIGMNISVRANVRTAEAARQSLQAGLTMAFRSGAVTGMLVAGLALLAIAGYFYALVSSGLEPTSRAVARLIAAIDEQLRHARSAEARAAWLKADARFSAAAGKKKKKLSISSCKKGPERGTRLVRARRALGAERGQARDVRRRRVRRSAAR
jgi:hypothetical protein